jgi:hypothetical protein
MHFPRYWTPAQRNGVTAWGWSDESLAHAQSVAKERLARILDWLSSGGTPQMQRYGYPDRPMREEVLKEFRAFDRTLSGAVTRNSYGCLVLNTASLMFVDVDEPAPKGQGLFAGWFGSGKADKERQAQEFEAGVLEAVNRWLSARADWGWRVYRTRAGIRLMATHQPVQPDDPWSGQSFDAFGADPLYRRLCASQKCFRARLTPKPWRCGVAKVGVRWPWASPKAEERFRKWEGRYLEKAGSYATCRLLGRFGNCEVHPALAALVEFHDQTTRVGLELPLA